VWVKQKKHFWRGSPKRLGNSRVFLDLRFLNHSAFFKRNKIVIVIIISGLRQKIYKKEYLKFFRYPVLYLKL